MNSRWPTTQDMRLPGWGRTLLKSLEQLALRRGRVRFSRRTAAGAKAGAPAPAAPGEPLMTAIPVSAREGYALWAETWDATPSPIVALEHRALLPWLAASASAPRDRCRAAAPDAGRRGSAAHRHGCFAGDARAWRRRSPGCADGSRWPMPRRCPSRAARRTSCSAR